MKSPVEIYERHQPGTEKKNDHGTCKFTYKSRLLISLPRWVKPHHNNSRDVWAGEAEIGSDICESNKQLLNFLLLMSECGLPTFDG